MTAIGRWVIVGVLWCLTSPAGAQTAQEQALAREFFEEGVAAAHAEQWNEAAAAFERSYELVPRRPALFNLASTLAQAGRLVEARERYQRYAAAAQDPDLLAEARRLIEEIEPRLARLTVIIENLSPEDEVRFNETTLAPAAIGAPLPTDPGQHVVTVSRGDEELLRHGLILSEGEQRRVSLNIPELIPDDPERYESSVFFDTAAPEEEEDGGGVFASPWFWVSVGTVLAIGAVVISVLAVNGGGQTTELGLYEGNVSVPNVGLN
ncbi:MAG: tetratricopeptide repeat protein [Myxococcota bacterium]